MCRPAWRKSVCETRKNGTRENFARSLINDPVTADGYTRPHPTATRVGNIYLGLYQHRRTSRAVAHNSLNLSSGWVVCSDWVGLRVGGAFKVGGTVGLPTVNEQNA